MSARLSLLVIVEVKVNKFGDGGGGLVDSFIFANWRRRDNK